MINTTLPNKYEDYWVEKPVERHRNIIGEYHVSSIGCDHSDLEPKDQSGPCMRETFYQYITPTNRPTIVEGNFHQGRMMHKESQRIYLINHPNSIAEFPLAIKIQRGDDEIIILGSIDIVEFTFDGILVKDFKSSSDWTFPSNKNDKNITHFDQVRIYSGWLQNILNKQLQKIIKNYVVYFAKHNLYTGEQEEDYDDKLCIMKFLNFLNRCWELHGHLKAMELPPSEPHKWCKFCDYRHRCFADVIYEEDVPTTTMEEIEFMYMKTTGKSCRYRGKYTKAFESFKLKFKIEGEHN